MSFGNWANVNVLTISGGTTNTDLTDFPVMIHLGGSSGITDYDMNAVMYNLTPATTSSGTVASGTYDSYTKFMYHCESDVSSADHNFTTYGSPVLVYNGKFDGSLYLNGTDTYVSMPDSDDWYFGSGNFTIDFWIKTTTTTVASVLYQGNAAGDAATVAMLVDIKADGKLGYYPDFNTYPSQHSLMSTISVNDGAWHHIAYVKNGNVYTLYIDGISNATLTLTYTHINSAFPFYIGAHHPYDHFQGYFDEFRISKGIARWTGNFDVPITPHVFDSYTKALLRFNGDLNRNITFNGAGATTLYGTGKFGSSVYFNGSDSYITTPDSDDFSFGSGDFTVDFWGYNITTNGAVFQIADSASYSTAFGQVSAGNMTFSASVSGTSWDIASNVSMGAVPSTTWVHYAVVRSGNVWATYRNGRRISTFVNSSAIYKPTGSAQFGRYRATNNSLVYTTGQVAEIRVSKGIARWTSEFVPPSAPYGTSWDNRKKIAVIADVPEPGVYDPFTKLLLRAEGDVSEGNNVVDFNDVVIDSTTYKFAPSSFSFDGVDDCISIDANPNLNFGYDDFTVDCWVKRNTIGQQYIFGQANSAGNADMSIFLKFNASDQLETGLTTDGSSSGLTTITSTSGYTDTVGWHHVAMTRGSNMVCVYWDGVLTSSGSYGGNVYYSTSKFSVGAMGEYTSDLCFDGYVDEFRISKGVSRWTADFTPPVSAYEELYGNITLPVEIEKWDAINSEAWLWTRVPTVYSGFDTTLKLCYDITADDNNYVGDTCDPIARSVWSNDYVSVWHLGQDPYGTVSVDAGETGAIRDSADMSAHATSYGYMTSSSVVSGAVDGSISFDGTNDYLYVGTTLSAVAAPYTVEMVAKSSNWSQNCVLMNIDAGTDYCFGVSGTEILVGTADYKYGLTPAASYLVNNQLQQWTSVVNSSSGIEFFLDGTRRTLTNLANFWAPSANTYIGMRASGNRFTGIADEVRISNSARSEDWIRTTYYSNLDNLLRYSEGVLFGFESPIPEDSSTHYGTTALLGVTVVLSGSASSGWLYDVSFYQSPDNTQVGSTVSGTTNGESVSSDSSMLTSSGTNYSWYVSATASGFGSTSPVYAFDNKFLCAGYVEVNGTRTSGVPIRLYLRSDGSLIGEDTTTGVSGTFEIVTDYNDYHYVIALSSGVDTNALIYDYVKPE